MDTNEKLLADYSAELELSANLTLERLIESHRTIRMNLKDAYAISNKRAEYWKEVYRIDSENAITKEVLNQMTVQEFAEWLNG